MSVKTKELAFSFLLETILKEQIKEASIFGNYY